MKTDGCWQTVKTAQRGWQRRVQCVDNLHNGDLGIIDWSWNLMSITGRDTQLSFLQPHCWPFTATANVDESEYGVRCFTWWLKDTHCHISSPGGWVHTATSHSDHRRWGCHRYESWICACFLDPVKTKQLHFLNFLLIANEISSSGGVEQHTGITIHHDKVLSKSYAFIVKVNH